MTTLLDPLASFDKPLRTPDFVASRTEDYSVLVRGRDRSGKAWRAVLPAALRGLWKTDIHGLRNYYFAGYTGGAGMAPDTWILALSFDEQARPVPFYITSYAAYDSKGIRDLLNLDGTGPQLLQLFEKWVLPLPETRPKLTAVPDSSKWVADYGNDPSSGIRAITLSLDKHGFRAAPEPGCSLESIGLVVQDSKTSRQIHVGHFFANSPSLPEIVRAGASVTVTGLNRWPGTDQCNASAVWANTE